MISRTISILLVDDDEDDFVITRRLLEEAKGPKFDLVWASTYAEAVRYIRSRHFDVFLVDYQLGEHTGLDLLRGELEQGRLGPVIILTGQGDHEIDVEAMRLGAAGYLVKGELRARELERTMRYAIERHESLSAEGRAPEPQPEVRPARVVAFLGVKGGVGTTSVVANVALVLAMRGVRITALELRGDYGPLTRLLNIAPLGDLGQMLATSEGTVDAEALEQQIALHPSGLRVLAAPQEIEHFRDLTAEQAEAIVSASRVGGDLVLIDLPAGARESTRAALRAADLVAVVLDREPSSLTAARVTLDLLRSWRVEAPMGTVIVSRVALQEALPIAEIHSALALRKYGVVPAAPDLFYRAAVNYTPVVAGRPEHLVSKALDELALCILLLR